METDLNLRAWGREGNNELGISRNSIQPLADPSIYYHLRGLLGRGLFEPEVIDPEMDIARFIQRRPGMVEIPVPW